MDLESVRREYTLGGLKREHLNEDPFEQFKKWLDQALKANLKDPTAMTVATVDENLAPKQRIVLLKGFDASGFRFYTNLTSDKARQLENNPNISLHFPWHDMERQVHISGFVQRLPQEANQAYFLSRPKSSQLAALASFQSQRISSRNELEKRFQALVKKYEDIKIEAPNFWGGYLVVPIRFEFWQGGAHRLHDRFEYCRESQNDNWEIYRLSP